MTGYYYSNYTNIIYTVLYYFISPFQHALWEENMLSGGDKMRFGKIILALAFSMAFVLMMIVVPAPVKGAVTQLELVPGKYTGTNIYVPGEVMSIVIHGDIVNEIYDVFSVIGEEQQIGGGITIQESGTAKVSYALPDVPDGDYLIRVRRPNGANETEAPFSIQGYSFNIETDRDSYLSGDELKIFWTANNIKDQTLPASGVGKIEIFSQNLTGRLEKILGPHQFDTAAGSVSFTLPDIVNYTHNFFVSGWFNDSANSPERIQSSIAGFEVKRLGVLIELDKNQYTVGSLLRVNVITLAAENQANPVITDTTEPGCSVSIAIKKVGLVSTTFPPVTLVTDSHGLVEYIVTLNHADFVDGAVFNVEVTASKGLNSIFDTVSFEISSSSSISVVLDFNMAQYASGEYLFANASASSIGDVISPSYTYIIEIRDNDTAGTLFSRETQSTGNFSFEIPENFEGWLWVRVTVDDGAGNSASAIEQIRVNYAIVLVNVNKENYNAGDELAITYEVIGALIGDPDTFYVIYDKEGSVVEEDAAKNGSFTFIVPSAPSDRYDFTVFASGGGRVVHGTASTYLYSGYVLLLDFNRAIYEPGDLMAIDYRILVMGNADMPATFTITYGLVNGPQASLQTEEQTGSLMYTIPENIDQGEQIFMASCDFGANSNEVVVVKDGANLWWYLRIWDIPLFSFTLLFITLFSLYVTFKTRSRVKKMRKDGFSASGPATGPTTPRRSQPDKTSGQVVQCAECGDPIEITTSRRPIEVMCPHCGEIQEVK